MTFSADDQRLAGSLQPEPAMGARWMRLGEWVLLALLTAYFGIHALPAAWQKLNTDFPNYYLTARLAKEGNDTSRVYEWVWLQRQKDHREIDQPVVGLVPITPFSTLAVWPVATMPPLEAKHVWLMLNLAMLAGVAVLVRSITGSATGLPWRRIALVAALSVPLQKNFLFGQYYLLLLFVLTLACWCYVRQRRFLAGLLTGLGFGLKLFPLIYLGYFLRKRDWKAFVGGLVGCLGSAAMSVAVFGWQVNRVLLMQVMPWALRGEGMDPYSRSTASIATLFHRLFVYEPQLNPHPSLHAAWMLSVFLPLAQILLMAPALLLARPNDDSPRRLQLEWSAVLVGSLAISTLPAGYHFTLLILPVCLMWRVVQERRGFAASAVLLALYVAIGFPGWLRIGEMSPVTLLSVPRLYVVIALCLFSYWLLGTKQLLAEQRRETWLWAGAFAVLTVFSIVSGLRHQRGLYADYAWRLPTSEEMLQTDNPAVQGAKVLSTAMLAGGYRTAVQDEDGIQFDEGAVDQLGVTATANERWTEEVGRESTIISSDAGRGQIRRAEVPVASPDGRWLAFLREEHGRGSLWVRSLGQPENTDKRITAEGFNVMEASFVPDGSMVFSAAKDGGRPGLFTVDSFGTIRPVGDEEARYPAVSPDGRWLAYSRLQGGNWHLWLREIRSGQASRLSEGDCNNMEPVWTSDSKSLVYASDCGRALWFTMLCRRRVVSQ